MNIVSRDDQDIALRPGPWLTQNDIKVTLFYTAVLDQ